MQQGKKEARKEQTFMLAQTSQRSLVGEQLLNGD